MQYAYLQQTLSNTMLSKKETPSKELREKIHACVSSFQKVGTAVKEALDQGRKEGFTDKDIGKMIREAMLRAGLTRQTANNYLPNSAKAKPRGNPSGRPPESKFSKNFLLNEVVVRPEILQPETILKEDILATDGFEEQKQQIDAVGNKPVPVPPSKSIIKLQSASVEPDPAEDEYDIEHLEKYSRRGLEQIIKWQHKHLHNEGTSWKSKYMSVKAAYKKTTGKDWVD
jgi:hypothetical protein